MAGPAAAVTRDRLSVALAVTSDALAETSDAVFFAVSAAFVVVVDSKRTMVRPIERPDRLMTRANDILERVSGEGERVTIDRARTQKLNSAAERRWEDGVLPVSECGWQPVGGAGFGEGTISRSRNGLGPEFEKKWEMLGRFRKALADLVQVSARKQPIKGPN